MNQQNVKGNTDFCEIQMNMILGALKEAYPEKIFSGYHNWRATDGVITIFLGNTNNGVILFKVEVASHPINSSIKMELWISNKADDIYDVASKLRKYFSRIGFKVKFF